MTARLAACPAWGTTWEDPVAARLGHRAVRCAGFTGLCGAGRGLRLLAGTVPGPGGADWRHSCTMSGDGGYWLVITVGDLVSGGIAALAVLCAAHRDALLQLARAGYLHACPAAPAPSRQMPWRYKLARRLHAFLPAGRDRGVVLVRDGRRA